MNEARIIDAILIIVNTSELIVIIVNLLKKCNCLEITKKCKNYV